MNDMTTTLQPDPLLPGVAPERVNYAKGVLLDAQDWMTDAQLNAVW